MGFVGNFARLSFAVQIQIAPFPRRIAIGDASARTTHGGEHRTDRRHLCPREAVPAFSLPTRGFQSLDARDSVDHDYSQVGITILFPYIRVRKLSGDWFIVHDFRGLNAKMRVPANPILRKEESYRAMAGGKLFWAMDLLWVSIKYAFVKTKSHTLRLPSRRLYEYFVTPMGVSSSPSCFNRLMLSIFSDQREFCQTYFDDIFVFTQSEEVNDHLSVLDKVFQRCVYQNLYIKLSKCTSSCLSVPSAPCLGDFIGRDRVRMDPAKCKVITDFPVPRTKHQLQSFLGTCVYGLRCSREFVTLAAPLTELTKGKAKNDTISFDEMHMTAFRELKSRLRAPPVLAHSDFALPLHVNMDASDFAIGGYLFQRDEQGAERIIAKKELLTVLHAKRMWKVYIIDSPFYINTDHHTIATILQQETCSQRLACRINELALFQPMFRWIEGTSNDVADMFSRTPFWNDGTAREISLSALLES
ncbi:Pol Polyprotein [Phytophthora megakarya]|uniref:Pol Polyprotein n=1 Tax=Phytophthora megakarya TaxID=4795 RepID=A0A225VX36_9STRA|nr:Pol Polyprotein [Phytophthora megakarya]